MKTRNVVTFALAFGAGLLWPSAPAAAQGQAQGQGVPTIDEVIEHLDELYRSSSSHAIMTMTVVRERGTRELTVESWSLGEEDALMVIRAPSREAGTATLRTEEGLWNYAPRADRLIRIPTGLLSESWMGSHFTNDDLMRETSYHDDYATTLSWGERDGERLLKVTLTPRPDAPVIYTEVVFWLTPTDWIPVAQEFYDDGELIRTMTFDEVETVAGRRIPMRMTLIPSDEPDQRTVVRYDVLELDVGVDPEMFTRRGLRRIAR